MPAQAELINPYPVDSAFQVSAKIQNSETLLVHWDIAPGYHLYKERFKFAISEPKDSIIGEITLPPGKKMHDEILGDYEAYHDSVDIPLPISPTQTPIVLRIGYQGCSDNNFCYPPQLKQVTLDPHAAEYTWVKGMNAPAATLNDSTGDLNQQDHVAALLQQDNLFLILLSFFGFGLLLAFTPCILPMIPILSGLIVGHEKKISVAHAFWLSLTYVLSMSVTYALAGIAAGFAGSTIQAALQNPWVIGSFSLVFVLLALSLFGFFELRLPQSFQSKITALSNKQKSGSYLGVAIMGCLATLIVSPCVSAPLVGALAYIGNTGNAALGGSALFVMGLGMGIPLLILGTSGGKLLPKAGPWMNHVKSFFGVLMLAVAIWMLARVIPGQITMLLWAGLLIMSSVYLGFLGPNQHHSWGKFWKGIGLLLAVYGIILMLGAATGNTDPLQPLAKLSHAKKSTQQGAQFTIIKSQADLDQALAKAKQNNQPTLVDFYADWCIACKEMEQNVFARPEVKQALSQYQLLKADITANDAVDKALQKQQAVIAPPTIIFFNPQGEEIVRYRIVGEMNKKDFLLHLQALEKFELQRQP